jgi:hypothetical protein
MISRILALLQRLELLLMLGAASLLTLGTATPAHPVGGSCVDACIAAFGTTFASGSRFYVLNDRGSSELGSGTVWCQYVGISM